MENSKDDLFKKLIQEAGIETPSSGFTEFVMYGVQLEIQNGMVVNSELKALLQQNAIEKPSTNFMANVMFEVEVPVYKIAAEPIINKKIWYWIAAASFALLAFVGFYYQASGEVQNAPTHNPDHIFDLISYNISAMPAVYSLSLIAFASLLLIDYFLRNTFTKPVF